MSENTEDEGRVRPSVEDALEDLRETWGIEGEQEEHIAELLNDTFNAGALWAQADLDVREAAIADRARREALEEAAKVCDQVADDYRNRRTTPKWTAEEAALRLRALASAPKGE